MSQASQSFPLRVDAAVVTARAREYRCKGRKDAGEQCNKLLFVAVKVNRLSKICPRCKHNNLFDD